MSALRTGLWCQSVSLVGALSFSRPLHLRMRPRSGWCEGRVAAATSCHEACCMVRGRCTSRYKFVGLLGEHVGVHGFVFIPFLARGILSGRACESMYAACPHTYEQPA